MKFYEIERIKRILGLPQSAGSAEIEARIAELRDKEQELEALKGEWRAREEAELKMSPWQALYKSEDWLGCWIGLGIIAAAILYFALTGMSFKAPAFRWTTDAEFQGHIAVMAPVVDRLVQQAGDKGEAAVQEAGQALQTAIAAKDRKAAGAAAKKLEAAAKEAKDKDLKKKAGDVGKDIGSQAGRLPDKVVSAENFKYSLYIFLAYLVIGIIGMALMGEPVGYFITGFPFVFLISWLSLFLAGNYTIHEYGLEYVLFCLILGLFVSNIIGVPKWMMPAVKTEFYIKTGLVILGARVLFGVILKAGSLGMVQALAVVGVVWYSCWWLCKRLQIDDEFSAMLASAVSICGVSAAIATAGAVKGDPKKLSYVTSIVLVCAVPMMVLMPIISKALGIPDAVAGAWLGGTLDTSGSVVAAGALISDLAMKVGVTVKMSQNVLIGVAAFILSVVWTLKGAKEGEKASLWEIWYRFPKFVLGFLASSILFSFILSDATIKAIGRPLQNLEVWWFALAFTSIGLETRFVDIAKLGGGRPALAFLAAQGFNIIWTLLLAYLLFGGIIFPTPVF
ncbi:MAG: putative sulfate exporter family transporter [Deltaproteobacteria bacterium]|nr:putative sulfate exporter family transporter [Deltaproteobacteria bacterium]